MRSTIRSIIIPEALWKTFPVERSLNDLLSDANAAEERLSRQVNSQLERKRLSRILARIESVALELEGSKGCGTEQFVGLEADAISALVEMAGHLPTVAPPPIVDEVSVPYKFIEPFKWFERLATLFKQIGRLQTEERKRLWKIFLEGKLTHDKTRLEPRVTPVPPGPAGVEIRGKSIHSSGESVSTQRRWYELFHAIDPSNLQMIVDNIPGITVDLLRSTAEHRVQLFTRAQKENAGVIDIFRSQRGSHEN